MWLYRKKTRDGEERVVDGESEQSELFAMKEIERKEEEKWIQREINILSEVNHPNIVALKEVYEEKEKVTLVMEYCRGGDLFDNLRKFGSKDMNISLIMSNLISSVMFLHDRDTVHRDLKLDNFVFDSEDIKSATIRPKLIDFGFAKNLKGTEGNKGDRGALRK